MARRRDRDGKPFLNEDLVTAGERLREDLELAQMGPRFAQNWDTFLSCGAAVGAGLQRAIGCPAVGRDRFADASTRVCRRRIALLLSFRRAWVGRTAYGVVGLVGQDFYARRNASAAITNWNAVNMACLLLKNLNPTKIWLSFDQNRKEAFKQNLNASYFS